MSRNDNSIMNSNGCSLTELIVVIGIIGILLGISAIFGHDMLVRSQVEGQTRELFTDLMNARVSALQKNRVYFVALATNQYAIYEDTNPAPDGDGYLQQAQDKRLLQKSTRYALSTAGTISFSTFGLASEESYTVRIGSSSNPNFDCIVIKPTRLLMGAWNGTDCTLQ